MPTKLDIANRNRQKRRRERQAKSFFKTIGIILLVALLLCAAIISGIYIAHTSTTNREIAKLKQNGLYRLVEVEPDRHMNVVSYGKVSSKHTIVTIASAGTNDFSVYTKNIFEPIKDDVHVVLIDRAGHGFSDDSKHDQTVEQIVSDYRTALEKANIQAPYTLFAHNFGAVYATWWASEYPDEIEAIIYLDGTIIDEDTELSPLKPTFEHKIKTVVNKIGIQRLFDEDIYNYTSNVLLPVDAECAQAMNAHSVCTMAYLSEMELMQENFDKVLESFDDNKIPKMYISASNSFALVEEVRKYCEHKNEKNGELGVKQFYDLSQSEEKINADMLQMIEDCSAKHEKTVVPFAENLGNCQIARIPGDFKIYEQRPGAILESVVDFIMFIDKEIPEIKDRYTDTKIINWEEYREQHKAEFENQYNKDTQEDQSSQQ